MRVAVFLDGRPGHEKQSKGILAALQTIRDVAVDEVRIERSGLLAYLVNLAKLYIFKDGGCPYDLAGVDLLLGTGSSTHLALLSCKKKYSVPVVTCMSPDFFLRRQFDLCFVPQHDNIPAKENIFPTIGPPNLSEATGSQDEGKGLILIGGVDKKSHHWQSKSIVASIEHIVGKEPQVQWTISSSPRTPEETASQVKAFCTTAANCAFYDYRDTEKGWIELQYKENKTVWVTADSISMVYEALTAGCCVGILPVRWRKKKNKFQQSGSYLLEHGLVLSYSDWCEGKVQWMDQNKDFNEARRCAMEITRRWFKKS